MSLPRSRLMDGNKSCFNLSMEETYCLPFLVIIKQSEMGLIIFPCCLSNNKAKVQHYMIPVSRHTSKLIIALNTIIILIFLVLSTSTKISRNMSWNGFVNDEDWNEELENFYNFMTTKHDKVRIS